MVLMPLTLHQMVDVLECIAPTRFAESWDNVGLLVEPAQDPLPVGQALLTIDLTTEVLDEALHTGVELVVAYHPPIFSGWKRLSTRDPQQRSVLRAVAAGVAIYSPHTALDAAPGGVNDWLAEGLGAGVREPLTDTVELPATEACKLVVHCPGEHLDALRDALARKASAGRIGNYDHCSYNLEGFGTFHGNDASSPVVGQSGKLETVREVRLEMVCARASLSQVAEVIREHHPYEEPAWDIYPLEGKPQKGTGMGRRVVLDEPITSEQLVERVKTRLGLTQVRLAESPAHRQGQTIRSVAVCAGAGGGLFETVSGVDAYVTGEMRHHDVLSKNAHGQSVILCDHSNTERGFLKVYAAQISARAGGAVRVRVSEADREPLQIV